MTSDELITRPRLRCSRHRGPTSGMCRQCFLAEMEEMLLDENHGMKRDDAHLLVLEWVQRAEQPTH